MAGRPSRKVYFPFKLPFKANSFWSFHFGGSSSGLPAGRLEKVMFLLRFKSFQIMVRGHGLCRFRPGIHKRFAYGSRTVCVRFVSPFVRSPRKGTTRRSNVQQANATFENTTEDNTNKESIQQFMIRALCNIQRRAAILSCLSKDVRKNSAT